MIAAVGETNGVVALVPDTVANDRYIGLTPVALKNAANGEKTIVH